MEDTFGSLRVDPYARVPLAVQLAEQVAWLIASGRIARNDRLPPIRALASHLGVNLHTVAAAYRQLEGDGLVSTRRGRGTIVLGYDRSRRSSHAPDVPTFTVGVLIPQHSDYADPILEGLQDVGEENAILFAVGATHDDPDRVEGYLDRLVAKNVDGMIIASLGWPQKPDLASGLLHAFAIPPIVYVDLPDAPGPKVLFDLETGTSKAAGHLLDHGHMRVGLVTGPAGWPHATPVWQGYLRAHEDRSVGVDPVLVFECPDLTAESGRAGAEALLGLSLPPRAFLAASSDLAYGVMRAIRNRGMRIPEHVAVVSCEDPATATLVDPPLTAVRLPAREMGRQAMSMLATLIQGGTVRPSMVILPTQLIVRRSCGCAG
jgi:DNA-binding LacI/PurR family transcriptional regulator